MVQITIDLQADELKQIGDKIPEVIKKGLDLTGKGLIGELTKNSPVDEGLLRQWFIESQSDDEIVIRTPAEYAKYVNDGTGIYGGGGLIKGPLVFKPGKKWNGPVGKSGLVFLQYSKGQPGQKFVEKSVDAITPQIPMYFRLAISEGLG